MPEHSIEHISFILSFRLEMTRFLVYVDNNGIIQRYLFTKLGNQPV
jgi:hypothetical protein